VGIGVGIGVGGTGVGIGLYNHNDDSEVFVVVDLLKIDIRCCCRLRRWRRSIDKQTHIKILVIKNATLA
jgi:hypothetical protein